MKQEVTDKLALEMIGRMYTYLSHECSNEFEKFVKGAILQQCAVNASRGCFWNIITKSKSTEKIYNSLDKAYDAIQEDEHYNIWRIADDKGVKNSFLVQVDYDYMVDVLDKCADPSIWNSYVKDLGMNHRRANMDALVQFFVSTRESSKKADPVIAIYNTNLRPEVLVNGFVREAFAVTFAELLLFCREQGFFIVAKGIGGKFDNMRINPTDLLNNKDLRNRFMETLRYTPGTNALQIQISMATKKELTNKVIQHEFTKDY